MTYLNTEKQKVKEIIDKQEQLAKSGANKEALLLNGGDTGKYGIYQLKDSPELRDFHFVGTACRQSLPESPSCRKKGTSVREKIMRLRKMQRKTRERCKSMNIVEAPK